MDAVGIIVIVVGVVGWCAYLGWAEAMHIRREIRKLQDQV